MNEQIIFKGSIGAFSWNAVPIDVPGYLSIWDGGTADRSDRVASVWHVSKQKEATINSLVTVAALMIVNGDNPFRPGSGVVKVSDSVYAAEYHHKTNPEVSFVIYDADSGNVKGGLLQNGTTMKEHATFNQNARHGDQKANGTALMMALIAALYDRNDEVKDCIDALKSAYGQPVPLPTDITDALFLLSDVMYFGLKDEKFPLNLTVDGNISRIQKKDIDNGVFMGTVVAGNPVLLNPKTVKKKAKKAIRDIAYYAALPTVQDYIDEHCSDWTAEEQLLIPQFPDDMPVPKEVSYLLTAFIGSEDNLRPIRNVLWRGTSGYGKSTGVEILAAILHKPLLRFTCSSTTEKQDFLTAIMPDVSAKPAMRSVSFEQIANDPEGAYYLLTGKEAPDGITCDDVFAEAVQRMAAATSSTPRYTMQESTYIRALKHGYIVEVQEASRIRDAGVLPGLNEYDRPGALIPQVDGSFVRRHRDAFVIYTDNVGYNSCNEYDPAVLRRMAIAIDSDKMEKQDVLNRIKRNLSAPSLKEVVEDNKLLSGMYDLWNKVLVYCEDHDLLSAGGCVTIEELERWIQMTAIAGKDSIADQFKMCVVGKATTDWSEQGNILALTKDALDKLEA